ncbi:molecular chaperone HtpG [Dokdonella fugitiva]|jgi:molecular chaperone HtpG|uniref:Chaperone protein HtpG n=1 Tax=Dokdonella fugitiva TaxID=328517 RepID=A0A4R2IB83_9GAMM|nr:molecular chaperone HtpG [Dokdonella fugitiva]MBA8883773.1 molecular chaperone HtpG [Dokdonella fugitiva]TCO41764.1 molecular chaperone HtpG [Dokdonella fugitiva]
MSNAVETRAFEAEVSQVLHLVTHSLYSHKEIFLRELVSNASDACDKLRFAALSDASLTADDAELRIEVSWDKDARTLTIRDNGVGMSRDEVVENIGTIARSGTRRFLESLSGDARKDTQLIGQFGVGFYSAFIVADRVTLVTRKAGAPAGEGVRWESGGSGDYTLETVDEPRRGTTVTLHLKDDESEFLDGWRLRELIKRYSDHVAFPIRLPVEKDGKPSGEFETVNHAAALWTRPKGEIKDEEYQAFYKSLSHDFNDALAWAHNRVEGSQSYTSLLYVPEKQPFDAVFSGRDERHGLKLYIRRVFIMDASEQLLPAYLRFVRGVVDSDDLPLNVSREILQENRLVAQIRSACVKRTLDLLEKIAKDEPAKYQQFTNAFGNVLKEGVAEDGANRERVARLLRFASTHGDDAQKNVSLDDYIGRMQAGQDVIWYVTADTHAAAKGSPQIESLRARGVEVLLLSDRIDEWMIGYLGEYAGKKLRNAAKGEIDAADGAEAEQRKQAEEAAKPMLDKLAGVLQGRVEQVRVSHRLTGSPSCIVLGEYDMALHMQRLLREAGHEVPASKPVLEVNPAHPLVQRFADEADAVRSADLGELLLEEAQLAAGDQLADPAAFIARMNRLLVA